MKRTIKRFSYLVYPLVFSLLVLGTPLPSFAQENITITTYYPSPMGSYNDLSVARYLDMENGLIVRSRLNTGAAWQNIMSISPNLITFLVPVTLNGAVTLNANVVSNRDITARNITATNTLSGAIVLAGIVNLGNAVAQRQAWDWTIFGSQQIQTLNMIATCAAVAISGPVQAIMVASILLSLGALLQPMPFPN